jgi:hypothetical protein
VAKVSDPEYDSLVSELTAQKITASLAKAVGALQLAPDAANALRLEFSRELHRLAVEEGT